MKKNLNGKVLKVLGLFTGIEGLNMICSVIKMKLIAIWLKTAGVALFGIFQTTIDTIGILTEMGLRDSAVRDIARTKGIKSRLYAVVVAVRRWCALSGIIGALIIVAASPYLAQWLLNDSSLWWQFALLSATMLFRSLLNGEHAILQGTDKLRNIAKGSFYGSLIGLAVSIPMFRFLGDNSVVLSIIAYAIAGYVATLCVRWRPSRGVENCSSSDEATKEDVYYQAPTWKESIKEGMGFVRLGAFIAIAAFIENIVRLVFLGWLQNSASLSTVGYYQAGYTVVIRYLGMIFVAMMMEFYPRLAANSNSSLRLRIFVSHEISLLLSVATPIILLMLLCRGLIFRVLYSEEFLVAVPFLTWAIGGTIMRVISTCMSITMLAKGDGKAYIITESIDSVIGLALNIILFKYWGLAGLGVAYLLWYLIYCLLTGAVFHFKYHLHLSGETWRAIFISLLSLAITLYAIEALPQLFAIVSTSLIILLYLRRIGKR